MGGSPVSPRRLLIGLGDSLRSLSFRGAAMATLILLSACSPANSSPTTTALLPPSSSTTAATTTVPSTTTSSTALASTTTSTTLPPAQDVVGGWSAFWDAWAAVRGSEDLDPEPLETAAAPDVVEGVIALFEGQRSSGAGPVETEFALHPKVTESGPDRATLEDCVLLTPSFTDTAGVWYQADLTRTGDSWIVETLQIRTTSGCVPEEVAAAAIAGYEAFYAGWTDFWDPANPDSPLIGEVLADPQKTIIVDLLTDHQARGVVLRGLPALHPEVIEVRSPTEVVILSCLEPDPNYGLYDRNSGERLDDVPPVRDGQRNLESAVMVLEDGHWKVSDLQGQVDYACEFAPTDRGLPSV